MFKVAPGEVADLVRALRPARPEPGTQIAHHLEEHHTVAEVWTTPDRATAVVRHQREAWILGEPNPAIGEWLHETDFEGAVSGGWTSMDISPAVDHVYRAQPDPWTVITVEEVPPHPHLTAGSDVTLRELRADDGPALAAMQSGQWVVDLWEAPGKMPYTACLVLGDAIVGIGAPRTLSPAYAEYAAWLHPGLQAQGVAFTAASQAFSRMLADGVTPCAVIRVGNRAARGIAAKLGATVVAEFRAFNFAPV